MPLLLTKHIQQLTVSERSGKLRTCECERMLLVPAGVHALEDIIPVPQRTFLFQRKCHTAFYDYFARSNASQRKSEKGRRLCRCFLWTAYGLAEAHGKLPKRALNLDSFSFYDYPSKNKCVERLSVSQAALSDILDHKWNPVLSFSHAHTNTHPATLDI